MIESGRASDEDLQQSMELVNFALNNVRESLFLVDHEGHFRRVNDEACRVLGYSREELLSMTVPDINLDMPTLSGWASYWEQLKARRSWIFESRHRAKDGHVIPVEVNANYFQYQGQSYNLGLVRDITERKLMRRQYRSLVDNIPLQIVRYDTDLQTTYVNPAWEKSTGMAASQVLGKPIAAILTAMTMTSHEMEEYEKRLRLVLESGVPQTLELTWVNGRGETLFFEYLMNAERDRQGKVVSALAVGYDHTARQQAKLERLAHLQFLETMDRVNRAIQGTQDLEQMLTDVLDVVLATLECDRAFLLYPCDPRAESWRVPVERTRLEYPGASSLGAAFSVDSEITQVFEILLAVDGPVTFGETLEYPVPTQAAEEFGILSQIGMAIYPKADAPYMFGLHQCSYSRCWTAEEKRLFQEIGRRLSDALTTLLAYRDLQESELRYRDVFENISDAVSIEELEKDGRFRVVDANPAAEKIVGLRGLAGHYLDEFTQPENAHGLELLRRCIEEQITIEFDEDFMGRQLHIVAVPVIRAAADRTRLLAVAHDHTHRKRAEEDVRRLNQELEQRVVERTAELAAANSELEAFAYSVSHDLRAPLRHIDGFIDLLRKRIWESLDERSRHYMGTISDSTRRMGQLIDDLLAFARMGRTEMSREPVELGSLVLEVVAEFAADSADREVRWQVDELPRVAGDRAMLRLVFENLIGNALKFTRPRAVAEIALGWSPGEPGYAVIFVRDNGVGFDPAYSNKLFGVFQRLHRADEFEGTGIGLANVRRIVGRHGGQTWAHGGLDQGATFFLSLPLLPDRKEQ